MLVKPTEKNLLKCASKCDTNGIIKCLNGGIDINCRDSSQKTPLHHAMKGGKEKAILELITHNANIRAIDKDGQTPLHIAATYGHEYICDILCDRLGAVDINAQNKKGQTPLHCALRNKKNGTAITLIMKGAKAEIVEKSSKKTALQLADSKFRPRLQQEVRDQLDKQRQREQDLCDAAAKGDMQRVYLALSVMMAKSTNNASSNSTATTAATAGGLCPPKPARPVSAISPNQQPQAGRGKGLGGRLVVDAELINIQNEDGQTALLLGSMAANQEIVKVLLTRGANVNEGDQYGRSPLHQAAVEEDLEMAKYLLSYGASPAHTNKSGRTPLHYAAEWGRIKMINLLLKQNAIYRNAERDNNNSSNSQFLAAKPTGEAPKAPVLSPRAPPEFSPQKSSVQWHSDVVTQQSPQPFTINVPQFRLPTNTLSKSDCIVDINQTDNRGYTPLHYSCKTGKAKAAVHLIQRGAVVDIADKEFNRTPLHSAAFWSRTKVCILLLNAKANPNLQDKDGNTPLHLAVQLNRIATARVLAAHSASDLAIQNQQHKTALQLAFENGRIALLENLFAGLVDENRTDVASALDACNGNGDSLLHLAVKAESAPLVTNMLHLNANIDIRNKQNKTPLEEAKSDEIKNLFSSAIRAAEAEKQRMEQQAKEEAKKREEQQVQATIAAAVNLLDAIDAGDIETATQLLDSHGAQSNFINIKSNPSKKEEWDGEYFTPLLLAAARGQLRHVILLLSRHATVDVVDSTGQSPLHLASYGGHIDVVRLFIDKNLYDVNEKDDYDSAPLHIAAIQNHPDVVALLIDSKADVDCLDENMLTPLHWAAIKGNKEVVEVLIEKKADVTAVDGDMQSPFDWAELKGFADIMALLQSSTTTTTTTTAASSTTTTGNATNEMQAGDLLEPEVIAKSIETGDIDTVRSWIEAGGDLSYRDQYDSTLLHVAAIYGKPEIAKLLLDTGKMDINTGDETEQTALHWAAMNGHKAVVEVLVEAKADLTLVDEEGQTAHGWATYKGHVAVVLYLDKFLS